MTFLRSYNYNLMGDYNIDKEKYYRVTKGNKVVYIPEDHMKNVEGANVGGKRKTRRSSRSSSSRKRSTSRSKSKN
jgi:2',3'-cyclic-nucleotide 2'-phosphodiesterase (5'-nucleotidase family)